MIPIDVPGGWRSGSFTVVASSSAAKREWDDFAAKAPKDMKRAYERISDRPLDVQGTRQFPLKGKRNKPFWEFEVTSGDRLHYAVDLRKRVVVVAVLPHSAESSAMLETVRARREAFDAVVVSQESVPNPAPASKPAETTIEKRKPRRREPERRAPQSVSDSPARSSIAPNVRTSCGPPDADGTVCDGTDYRFSASVTAATPGVTRQ